MEHRIYRKTGEAVSLLGYGNMRLPVKNVNGEDVIDTEEGKRLIDYAYQHGVNYFDTAYMYHGGKSEVFLSEALTRYPRDSYFLADKMPGWYSEGKLERVKEIFAEQLDRCKAEYFDFYLCHSLGDKKDFIRTYLDGGALAYLESEQKAGRIRNLGFSYHGDVEFFRYLMELRQWDFCQIQLNYLDWDNQNAKELYRLAEEHGVQLIIMEPVRGGGLVKLCEEAVDILHTAEPDRSTASWAIRFAASLPNVLCVLSGMSTMDQVEDNVRTMTDFKPLTDADKETLSRAVAAYMGKNTVPCTGCRYCFECPKGIAIPEMFAAYNACAAANKLPLSMGLSKEEYEEHRKAFAQAFVSIPEEKLAWECLWCKKCVEHCPQKIRIPDKLGEISGMLKNARG